MPPETTMHQEIASSRFSRSTEALVREAREGDRRAQNELFARYLAPLRRAARRQMFPLLRAHHDSEDMVQSAVRAALVDLGDFRPQGPRSFYRWLCKVLKYKMIGAARKAKARKRFPTEGTEKYRHLSLSHHPEAGPGPATQCEETEKAELLKRQVSDMNPSQRKVIAMQLEELKDHEIAKSVGISRHAARRLRVSTMLALGRSLRGLESR